MPTCEKCGSYFPTTMKIDGKRRVLNKRKYCLDCSPFGLHNTRPILDEKQRLAASVVAPLPPSSDLAYLIGVISGDGCLYKYTRTCELIIKCDDRYPELISTYAELVGKLLPGRVRIDRTPAGNCTAVRLYSVLLPALLGLPSGAKETSGYTVPEWIFDSTEYVKPFIRGLIETDGGVCIINRGKASGWHCHFTAFNEVIMQAFLRGTKMLGYEFKRNKVKARIDITEKVKSFVQTLEISKHREYTYW